MSFELVFNESALKEWRKLDATIRDQFKKKLIERLDQPRIASAQLFGSEDRYKIKLRAVGYRLVHEVVDRQLVVVVIAVGRRDRNAAYRAAAMRER